MRKINTILAVMILILLLDHAVFAALYCLDIGSGIIRPLAHSMLGLTLFHALISLIVTIRAEKAGMVTKARYNQENRAFWNRRVTGMLILILAIMHAWLMKKNETGIPQVAFVPGIFELITPLLIIVVYLHVLSNIRPLMISLGIRKIEKKEKIIRILFSLIMVFALAAVSYKIYPYLGGH